MIRYRQGTINDLAQLKELAIAAWSPFKNELTEDNWQKLYANISDENTYIDLLASTHCYVCENENKEIIGKAYLKPSGNAFDFFEKDWCVIRFVSVHPAFSGKGIGRKLTELCIDLAKQNKEKTIALHTSEMMNNARHIYESYGFTILKEIEMRLGKRYWVYTLSL